ncbi:penicillin acylase family protein [Candidatus Bathyarchaeota archaeon]|nr:penicillin acylase family protein [Candidatus Bathyarchaeota archaeon]
MSTRLESESKSGFEPNNPNPTERSPSLRREAVIALLKGEDMAKILTRYGITMDELMAWRDEYLRAKVPPLNAQIKAPVRQRVEILRDRWGIPHIFAQNSHDLFLGLGFAMAQDRLFQMDYYRHLAYGRLAELIGDEGLRSDIAARTLDFASTARSEFENLSPEAREMLEAFSEGVNLAIVSFGEELPFEFDLLDHKPEPWKPEDNLTMERATLWEFGGRIEAIAMAEAAYRFLPEALAKRLLSVEHGDIPICQVQSFESSTLSRDKIDQACEGGEGDCDELGSNNWAVAGRRSLSGGALLASDGHIPYTQPATNYEVHLCGAGYNVIGVVRAARLMPYNGRNEHVAWGGTNNNTSTRDLYVEEVHPENPNLYRQGNEWLPFHERKERILVRGGKVVELTVRSTIRGPIVNALIPSVDEAGDPPLSLRWVGAEPCDTFTVSLRLMKAKDAEEFRRILADWKVTASNSGFVDDKGRCAVQIRGRVPIRGRITLGFRRANNPDDEWKGFIPFEGLPYEFDPPKGWIASANNRPAPPGYPWPLYGNYADGYRMKRIIERLEAKEAFSLEDMASMQMDVFLERAAEICPSLVRILRKSSKARSDPRIARACEYLESWDYRFTLDSVAASIFSAFWNAWRRIVIEARLPAHVRRMGFRTLVATELLTKGDELGWFPEGRKLEAKVLTAMLEGLDWLEAHLGPGMDSWKWGRLHQVTFRHYLVASEALDATPLAQVANVGPFPCAGTDGCLNSQGYSIGRLYQVRSGPHFRFLVDMAKPFVAYGCNSTGNSGHPGSPHYRDQIKDWLEGKYHPMYMRREDIEANLEGRTILEPR